MIKKEYINPEMEVVVLNMNQQLLAGSIGTDPTPADPKDSDAPFFEGLPGLPGTDLPGFGF